MQGHWCAAGYCGARACIRRNTGVVADCAYLPFPELVRVPIWAQHYVFIPHVRVVAFTNVRHGVLRELRGTKQQRTDLL